MSIPNTFAQSVRESQAISQRYYPKEVRVTITCHHKVPPENQYRIGHVIFELDDLIWISVFLVVVLLLLSACSIPGKLEPQWIQFGED